MPLEKIKNRMKREDVHRKRKREKHQNKLQRRLEQAKMEIADPEARTVCIGASLNVKALTMPRNEFVTMFREH